MRYMRNNCGGPTRGRSVVVQENMSNCTTPRTRTAVIEEKTVCTDLPVMVFIKPQVWDCTYSCGQALTRGTLFPALDKPFMGKGGCCNG